MGRAQFTLRHWMVAVAILGIVLAMPRPTVLTGAIFLVLAVPALVISQLPYGVRLRVEIAILLVLLIHQAWLRESFFYAGQAERAVRLSRCASDWAAVSKSPGMRAILRREAAWFSLRAVTLRVKALWEGFLYGRTYPSGRLSRLEHRRLLDLLWEMQRHEDAARQAHESSYPGGLWP